MKYICNALSLQMSDMSIGNFQFCQISEEMFKVLSADAESYVGHKDLAKYLNVPYNRSNLDLKDGDVLYVAQLKNGRLKEGTTELPSDLEIKYYQVVIMGE